MIRSCHLPSKGSLANISTALDTQFGASGGATQDSGEGLVPRERLGAKTLPDKDLIRLVAAAGLGAAEGRGDGPTDAMGELAIDLATDSSMRHNKLRMASEMPRMPS